MRAYVSQVICNVNVATHIIFYTRVLNNCRGKIKYMHNLSNFFGILYQNFCQKSTKNFVKMFFCSSCSSSWFILQGTGSCYPGKIYNFTWTLGSELIKKNYVIIGLTSYAINSQKKQYYFFWEMRNIFQFCLSISCLVTIKAFSNAKLQWCQLNYGQM